MGLQKGAGFDEILDNALDTKGNETLVRETRATLGLITYSLIRALVSKAIWEAEHEHEALLP